MPKTNAKTEAKVNKSKPAAKPVKAQTANTAPKRKPMPNGKSVNAGLDKREPKWSDRRVALVKAMRALGAVNFTTAVTAEDIAKKMGNVDGIKMIDRVDLVKIILDVYRTAELLHNGFAESCRHEGERGLRYFLTKKGQTTTFPAKEAAEKPAKEEKAAPKKKVSKPAKPEPGAQADAG